MTFSADDMPDRDGEWRSIFTQAVAAMEAAGVRRGRHCRYCGPVYGVGYSGRQGLVCERCLEPAIRSIGAGCG